MLTLRVRTHEDDRIRHAAARSRVTVAESVRGAALARARRIELGDAARGGQEHEKPPGRRAVATGGPSTFEERGHESASTKLRDEAGWGKTAYVYATRPA